MLSRWTSSTDVPMGVLAECECAPARTAGVPVDGARRGEGGGLGLPARDGPPPLVFFSCDTAVG